MANPYQCPNCKTNRTRFNIIEQSASPVKMDPQSGEVVDDYSSGGLDILHAPYNGPSHKVQCAACGLVEDEQQFVKFAQHNQKR